MPGHICLLYPRGRRGRDCLDTFVFYILEAVVLVIVCIALYMKIYVPYISCGRGRRVPVHMVVGFTTTCAISAYHY
jgi:hypothetical protein